MTARSLGRSSETARGATFESRDALDPVRFRARLLELSRRPPFRFPREAVPADFRRASVLIPFWEDHGGLRVVMTRRTESLSGHAGQMAFPGGRLEPGESWESAALREAEEEVGIPARSVEIAGRLDDAWSGARHHLVPVVAWLRDAPDFVPNPREVAEIHQPLVSDLLRPEARSEEEVEIRGVRYVNPIVAWPGGRAYGLSADLLLEALEWATGGDPVRGAVRLAELEAYLAPQRTPDADG